MTELNLGKEGKINLRVRRRGKRWGISACSKPFVRMQLEVTRMQEEKVGKMILRYDSDNWKYCITTRKEIDLNIEHHEVTSIEKKIFG